MSRRTMARQVTKTTVKSAVMELVDGLPKAIALDDVTFIGNYSLERAQREITKEHPGATVLEVRPETLVYEMPVSEYIKYATPREIENE